jgi:hypothetical protein
MHWFFAYIDPGAGSLIVQATIATIVAVPYLFRRQIGRFARLFTRRDQQASAQLTPPNKAG